MKQNLDDFIKKDLRIIGNKMSELKKIYNELQDIIFQFKDKISIVDGKRAELESVIHGFLYHLKGKGDELTTSQYIETVKNKVKKIEEGYIIT